MHLVVEYLRVSNILATVQSLNFVQLGVKLNQHFRKGGISRVILKMSSVNRVSKKNKIQILLFFLCHLNDFKGTCVIGRVCAGSKSGLYEEINIHLKRKLTANSLKGGFGSKGLPSVKWLSSIQYRRIEKQNPVLDSEMREIWISAEISTLIPN